MAGTGTVTGTGTGTGRARGSQPEERATATAQDPMASGSLRLPNGMGNKCVLYMFFRQPYINRTASHIPLYADAICQAHMLGGIRVFSN